MRFAIITKDKDDALQVRLDTRPDHIAYLKDTGVVEMAGPFLNEDGQMHGSLIVIDVADYDAARAWADNDPYTKAGLFDKVRIEAWNRVVG